jgi:ribulose-phosphate 3-epimerase
MTVRIAPSVLSADFGRLADDVARCEAGGADWIHVDVMDGSFVPNLTFGVKIIETLRRLTKLPLDVHLMVVEPEKYFDSFAGAGANVVTIHQEAAPHLHRQLHRIRELGCRAGAAINPSTPVESLRDVVVDLDLLLVMTVNPGFGGQRFIEGTVSKIARAKQMLMAAGSAAVLEVDGGIARDTIARCWRAGADTFVAGNAVFSAPDAAVEIRELRLRCSEQA